MSKIIIAKNEAGHWHATRTSEAHVLELTPPVQHSHNVNDLAKWCRRCFPRDYIGVVTRDIGPKTASIEGPILRLSKWISRWPWIGGAA